MNRRVVITGVGVRSSNARNYKEFVNVSKQGVPGQSDITLFDTTRLSSNIACQIQDDLKYQNSEIERVNAIAYEAIDDFLEDEGIRTVIEENKDRIVFSFASSLSGNATTMKYVDAKGDSDNSEYIFNVPDAVIRVANYLGVRGPIYTTMAACASGTSGAGIGVASVESGQTDVAIVGGSDALTKFSSVGFSLLNSLSVDACKPFDENRSGINLGEASAFFLFEEYEHAKARNAKIYGEIVGYSMRNDAYHMTSPQPDGDGAYAVMEEALREAALPMKGETIYINAHGTGTRANDTVELKAISKLFKGIPNVYVSSTKAITGHCLGSAGSIEIAAAIASLNENFIPHTIHTEHVMETDENINIVVNPKKDITVDYVISNSFAFAGNNACIIIKRNMED